MINSVHNIKSGKHYIKIGPYNIISSEHKMTLCSNLFSCDHNITKCVLVLISYLINIFFL